MVASLRLGAGHVANHLEKHVCKEAVDSRWTKRLSKLFLKNKKGELSVYQVPRGGGLSP